MAELRARVGRPQTREAPQQFLLLAVPRRLYCLGSVVILNVVCRYLSLFMSLCAVIFFPRDVLGEIWALIGSISGFFSTYFSLIV